MICPHCGGAFKTALTAANVERILVLSKDGMSSREISPIIGCSFASVARIVRLGKEALKKEWQGDKLGEEVISDLKAYYRKSRTSRKTKTAKKKL